MSTTERDEIAALLPPAPPERDLPAPHRAVLLTALGSVPHRAGLLSALTSAPRRGQVGALTSARRRTNWAAPLLTAAALVLVIALTAGVGLFLARDSAPGRVASPAPGQGLAELNLVLERLEAQNTLNGRKNEYPNDDFLYVKDVNDRGLVAEHWYSVDGSKPSLISVNGAAPTLEHGPTGDQSRTTPAEALLDRTTLPRLRAARADYTPRQFYEALKGLNNSADVFRQIVQMLYQGGLVDPELRVWLYRTAARVPGVYYVPDTRVQKLPARGLGLTGADGVQRRILFNADGGGLMAVGATHDEPGLFDYTFLGYGISPQAGTLPEQVFRQQYVPLSERPGPLVSGAVPATRPVRAVDFTNGIRQLPFLVGGGRLVSLTPPVADEPAARFVDGTAELPSGGAEPLRLRIDPRRFPVRYLRPAPGQVGAESGPVPEDAIVVVEVRDPEGTKYAVVAFTSESTAVRPEPALRVMLVVGTPPVVTTQGNAVSIVEKPGRAPVRFERYLNRGFVRTN